MVTISREASAQAEARLRAIFRGSGVRWLPGYWSFLEGEEASLVDGGSIAVVRDEGRLSALCPAVEARADLERFEVFRVVLPAGADDSGFVGWLASRIKAVTGSGVFVVCGHDRERGGVFDYYGVPEAAADDVRALLGRLGGLVGPGGHTSLDGVVMTVRETSPGAVVEPGTVFCFDQHGTLVTARYGGGSIADGWLAGVIDPKASLLRFRYLQIGTDGAIDSGHSNAEIGRLPDGRLQLVEHFTWASRQGSGVNRLQEVECPLQGISPTAAG